MPINVTLKPLEVFEKEDARFDAILSRPIVKKETNWMFKNNRLFETSKHSLESAKDSSKHSITVHNCSLEDAGEYVFTVRNKKTPVTLIVNGI